MSYSLKHKPVTDRQFSVERENDVIYVTQLKHSLNVSDFIRVLNDGIKKGYTDFEINFSGVNAVFPNAVVPIAGIMEHHKTNGVTFEFTYVPLSLTQCKMLAPVSIQKDNALLGKNSLNKVWKFRDSNDISKIVQSFMDELHKSERFSKGTLPSIEWAIYEVMDNVIQHAGTDLGYVMGQLHSRSKHIAFTIFDLGQGIYNSLKNSVHAPRNTIDALTLCIQEEVTRDKKIGQGNGLFGLHSIVKQGKGSLSITSGDGCYMYNNGYVKTYKYIPFVSKKNVDTTIDFQLDYSKELSLDKALIFRGKEYALINLRVENLENESGYLEYKIKEHAEGTGTRQSAIRVKNEIVNLLEESKTRIIIDFTGIEVISSSFADELIAKLLLELGIFQFNNLIQLKGMDISLQNILQRSVIQRLIEEFK